MYTAIFFFKYPITDRCNSRSLLTICHLNTQLNLLIETEGGKIIYICMYSIYTERERGGAFQVVRLHMHNNICYITDREENVYL